MSGRFSERVGSSRHQIPTRGCGAQRLGRPILVAAVSHSVPRFFVFLLGVFFGTEWNAIL